MLYLVTWGREHFIGGGQWGQLLGREHGSLLRREERLLLQAVHSIHCLGGFPVGLGSMGSCPGTLLQGVGEEVGHKSLRHGALYATAGGWGACGTLATGFQDSVPCQAEPIPSPRAPSHLAAAAPCWMLQGRNRSGSACSYKEQIWS